MKSHKRILAAFLLNLFFSVFEFVGGIFTGSVAILSDSLHDMGDALSIGISYFLEKKSKQKPDDSYTYGYGGYSVIGSIIMTLILTLGSAVIIYKSVLRLLSPSPVNYDGMLILAVIGLGVNFLAAFVTHEGHSLNEKAVNLHMLEDVLGWAVVLVGAIVMKFTDISIIDPILSLCVAVFVIVNALKTLCAAVSLFLEKTPKGIDLNHIREEILQTEGILDVHHIHLWSLDSVTNCATMHIVTSEPANVAALKASVRKILCENNINHATIETESPCEECPHKDCNVTCEHSHHGHNHSHHGHHHSHHH